MNPFLTSNGNRCPYCGNQLVVKVSKGGDMPNSRYIRCTNPHEGDHIYFYRFPLLAPANTALVNTAPPSSMPSNSAKAKCAAPACKSARLDPGCPRSMCRRHCSQAGSCTLWPHEREQRKKDTGGALAPTALPTVPAPLPAPSLAAPRRRRQRIVDYTAVDYSSLDDWVANTLPPIRALEAYKPPLDADLRHLDNLPGVKSPTPEVESVREMYERHVREDEARLLSCADTGPSHSRPHSAPLRLPTSIINVGSRSLSPIDLSLRSLSPSPDFPATVPLPIADKAHTAEKRSTAAPLRITTQLNDDWMNASPASKTASPSTFYVKKKAGAASARRFMVVYWNEVHMAHRVFWIEEAPSWPEWRVSEATGPFAKVLGDHAEVDLFHPKFKTWAAIQLTFVHTVTTECVIMLRRRDIECHDLDATLRIFYPNDNNTIHIRKNLRAERTDLRRLYKSSRKGKRIMDDTDSESDVQIVEVKKRVKREDDDEPHHRQRPRLHVNVIDINDTDNDCSTPALTTASSLPSPTLLSPVPSSSSLPFESPQFRTPGVRWPTGVHVVDMVKGFKLMDSLASTGLSREDRFKRAFNEPYRQSTVTDQRAVYRAATAAEIKRGIDAGWSKEGLWTVWRKSLASAQ